MDDSTNISTNDYRELRKLSSTLKYVEQYLRREDEKNAAKHTTEEVLYSPLTVAVIGRRAYVDRLLTTHGPEDMGT